MQNLTDYIWRINGVRGLTGGAVARLGILLAMFALAGSTAEARAQGVTSGSLSGVVRNAQQQPVAGASVIAIHAPSGTSYEAQTRADGRFAIPNMRVGGPYVVTVAYIGAGTAFEPETQEGLAVNLGVATDVAFEIKTIAVTETVTVIGTSDPVFSSTRTGAATAVSRQDIAALPNLSNRLENFVRLTPQASGMSIAGQDNRLNNITVDGSYFNNSFGLGGSPGDRTGVAPISPQAIEAIQVNVAPFDVRQGNFVGAGINTVTRSGTNQFRGSVYRQFRNESMVGTEAKNATVNPGTFKFGNTGGWLGGPVVKNKIFFFGNFEDEALTQPGTTFRANSGGETAGGAVTRVLASDLDALGSFLQSRFNYATGPYQGYDFKTPARRILAKGDYNINSANKVSFRYTQLDSDTDVLLSNSSSLGFGTRRSNTTGLNFQSSNYTILENIRSGIGEWNSVLGNSMANSLIIGYTKQDESRGAAGPLFPLVDILDSNTTYTSFGTEPFTPNNELRYNTFQLQNNFTKFADKHSLTFGGSLERYESENVFFSGSQSVYVYNSLADFYTDANGYVANPNRTTSPVALERFQVRWINIPGLDKPVQPLQVLYGGAYAQDEWAVADNLKLTLGVRLDVPRFDDTGFDNPLADAMTFRDESGQPVQYSSAKLPDANILWSPRAGFNWNVDAERRTQVRGGTGVFTGRPAYVWISNQIGSTGVLTGFERLNATTVRPFNPNPATYKPTNVTGAPASTYELAITEPSFKFPQVWRSNIAVDQRLPFGMTGTAEFLYNRDVNGVYYINANLPAPTAAFVGPDNRSRWTAGNKINAPVDNAVVLKNQNVGRSWNAAASLGKSFSGGSIRGAYSYGDSKNTVDPGSVAFGSWNGNPHSGDPNNPGLGYSSAAARHRVFVAASYSKEYFSFGQTTVSVFFEGRTIGNTSYTVSGDLNGDGGTANDLIYIARDISEMNFQTYATGGITFTAAQQAQAWEAYIAQDKYLKEHRGQYSQRGAVFLPMLRRTDFSIAQDLFKDIRGRRNSFQFRADVINFGNLLNKNWGVSQRLVNAQPLILPTAAQGGPADVNGAAQYRLRVVNNALVSTTFEQTAEVTSDVYRILLSLRYTF